MRPCAQVDMDAGTYEKTQDYYPLGQFSKFVEKSATYLKTDGNYDYPDGTGVQTVAFRNPSGSMVVVIVNKIVTPLKVHLVFTWHKTTFGQHSSF